MNIHVLKIWGFSPKHLRRTGWILALLLCLSVGILLGVGGCKGRTISPTEPIATVEPEPTPSPEETPDREETPTPDGRISCDDYADSPDDPDIEFLDVDGETVTVNLECTGDTDWYKIEFFFEEIETLNILLANIPQGSDFDMIAYDAELIELEDGRSAQSGNTDESLSLSSLDTSLIYLRIHSYSGRGTAELSVSQGEADDQSSGEGTSDEAPDIPDDTWPDENEPDHLGYEEVLSTYYPLYPRGSSSDVLEHSVENVSVETITCRTPSGTLTGEFTIGNYAHVERDLLDMVDYIDGWGLVVFNGPLEVLDILNITVRVTIFSPELDLDVQVPYEMDVQGDDYLVSEKETNVYYVARSYGDFWGNSSEDIQVSSGVIGEATDIFSDTIFTQQVEVEWRADLADGVVCSGDLEGEEIVDFKTNNSRFFLGR